MLIHLISSDIETVNLLTVIKFLSSLQTYVKSSTMRVATIENSPSANAEQNKETKQTRRVL